MKPKLQDLSLFMRTLVHRPVPLQDPVQVMSYAPTGWGGGEAHSCTVEFAGK